MGGRKSVRPLCVYMVMMFQFVGSEGEKYLKYV